MFVDCQNPAGLWGRNFVGNWFVALQCKTIHYFVTQTTLLNISVGVNALVK